MRPERGTTPPRSRRGGHRAGVQNYNSDDIETLLDIVEEVEPFGANMWATVSLKYNILDSNHGLLARNQVFIKCKFDKLVNTKNKN